MAIKTVQAVINGQTYNLTLIEGETKKYKATPTAPGDSSFNLEGGYYPVSVKVVDTAGNETTADHTHSTLGANLRLYAKEQHKPVITILEPTAGSYIKNSKPTIMFKIVDNNVQTSGYSGVNKDSVVLKVNGNVISNDLITWDDENDIHIGTYTPKETIADGDCTISVDCSDNDGNAAVTATATFEIDTLAPSLTILSPTDGFETNQPKIEISGTTDAPTVKVALNGLVIEECNVVDNTFNTSVELTSQGNNIVKITAIDDAGNETEATRNVVFNTTAPVIKSVTIDPNPVYCGTVYEIIVEVE